MEQNTSELPSAYQFFLVAAKIIGVSIRLTATAFIILISNIPTSSFD
jgi:hypothetical protein